MCLGHKWKIKVPCSNLTENNSWSRCGAYKWFTQSAGPGSAPLQSRSWRWALVKKVQLAPPCCSLLSLSILLVPSHASFSPGKVVPVLLLWSQKSVREVFARGTFCYCLVLGSCWIVCSTRLDSGLWLHAVGARDAHRGRRQEIVRV